MVREHAPATLHNNKKKQVKAKTSTHFQTFRCLQQNVYFSGCHQLWNPLQNISRRSINIFQALKNTKNEQLERG